MHDRKIYEIGVNNLSLYKFYKLAIFINMLHFYYKYPSQRAKIQLFLNILKYGKMLTKNIPEAVSKC